MNVVFISSEISCRYQYLQPPGIISIPATNHWSLSSPGNLEVNRLKNKQLHSRLSTLQIKPLSAVLCWGREPDLSVPVNYKKMGMERKAEAEGHSIEREKISTFGCFQPLLFDAVADLSLGLALREVALNDGRVALVHLDLLLVVRLKIPQLCKATEMRGS